MCLLIFDFKSDKFIWNKSVFGVTIEKTKRNEDERTQAKLVSRNKMLSIGIQLNNYLISIYTSSPYCIINIFSEIEPPKDYTSECLYVYVYVGNVYNARILYDAREFHWNSLKCSVCNVYKMKINLLSIETINIEQ